MKSVLQFPDVC